MSLSTSFVGTGGIAHRSKVLEAVRRVVERSYVSASVVTPSISGTNTVRRAAWPPRGARVVERAYVSTAV